ncbi:hypothetical protein SOPP22_09970 [Shewanella sp. OPT22]|nr:hypothetical protein SOPP22_09970 [Shewanella sp. OPT22]
MDVRSNISHKTKQVVITGMGAITPLGLDMNNIHARMCLGETGISSISKFSTDNFKIKCAGEVRGFDAQNYGVDPNYIHRLSDINLWGCAAADIAIKDAGLNLQTNPIKDASHEAKNRHLRFGVSVGTGHTDFSAILDALNQSQNGESGIRFNPKQIPANLFSRSRPASTASLISIRYGLAGPMLCANAASATGAVNIMNAADAIHLNRADVMLAGGADSGVNPLTAAVFQMNKSGSCANQCLPFDENRDGVVLGEGSCVLVLEELEHALQRDADIYGVINGYGTSNDCFDMTRIPTSAPGLSDAINLCLKDADISQEQIEYINVHGTATKLNDIAETYAVNNAFTLSPKVSGFKGYTGHMLGACGAFEVAMTLYSMAKK